MLIDLRISNLAIIDHSEIQCGPGLNVLTGETGAGKSILINALGLLIGERAAADRVGSGKAGEVASSGAESAPPGTPKTPAARALVEGAFDLSATPAAIAYLQEQEIPLDDCQLVIAREISADGRSRVRLNGRLATATTLRELGGLLIDIHGQHEHQMLLNADTHLGFLDAFGDAAHATRRATARDKYAKWREAQRRLDDLTGNEQQRAQRLDMLQFQADEIDATAPQADEDTQLLDERLRLMNAEKLRAAASLCRDALLGHEEPGALALLQQALKAAREIQAVDGSVAPWADELQSAIYQLEDAAGEARSYADIMEADPLRLEEVEARLHRLNRLKRKYGDTITGVIAHRAQIEAELQSLNLSDTELGSLREVAERERAEFLKAAQKLSQARQQIAGRFNEAVVKHLRTLAMERARFETHFETLEDGTKDGIDRVEFLFSANPGQPLRPLARIASGGEISRVMLALRSVLGTSEGAGQASRTPIIVFDEIDVGIGGVTAEAVGEKMQELAHQFQVFCITHLPQIARRADRHYCVTKETGEAQTRVTVTLLEDKSRVREIARMMGNESDANLRHARELLKR